jgi:hypothetical protein
MTAAVKKQKLPTTANKISGAISTDFELSEKNVWILLGLVAMVMVYWMIHSPRPYDDDNIGRYFMAQAAWSKPEFFLSLWGRPLAILFFLIPSQFGYAFCSASTLAVTMGTCYFTYKAAKQSNRPYAWCVVIFLAFQPVFFSTAWSLCTEPLAAFFLAIGLFYYYRKNYTVSALLLSAVPLARIEMVLILPLFAFNYFREKKYVSILCLGTGLLLFQVAGMIGTGDWLYLLTASRGFGEGLYQNGPFEHYFQRFIFIVGPVVFVFMMLKLMLDIKAKRFSVINISVLAMFCFHVFLYWKGSGMVVGFLRHFVAVAPMMALLALDGFKSWMDGEMDQKDRTLALLVLAAATMTILIYYSFDLVGDYFLSEDKEYMKLAMALGISLLFIFQKYLKMDGSLMRRVMLVTGLACSVLYCLNKEKPLQLAPEHQTVKTFHAYFEQNLKNKVPLVMIAHPWFFFFDNFNYYRDPYSAGNYLEMRTEKLDQLPAGSIVVWDSHYSWRLSSNVQEADLSKNPNFKFVQQFISPDRKFGIFIFTKMKG